MSEPPALDQIATLFSAQTIAARVDALAGAIAACELREPLVVAVLKLSLIHISEPTRLQ